MKFNLRKLEQTVFNLSLHIEYLLLRHDCVVVPGLGAFINVRHAASFDAKRGVWRPMTREVRFNGALSHDDGLLSSSYARKNDTSFQEGREMLRRDIRQLISTLESDGEATLGQLGILSRTEDTVTFTPRHNAAQWAASLGYTEASVVYDRATATKPTADRPEPERTLTNENSVNDSPEEIKSRVFDTERNYYIAVNKIFARTAACLLLVAIAAVSFLIPVSDHSREDQASVVPVEKIIRDTASRIASAVNENSDTTAISQVAEDKTDETEVAAASHRFHAIVATFASKEEAEKFIEQNEGTGFKLKVVSSRTKSRVSALSSTDSGELRSAMTEPEFRSRFSQAWIWEDTTQNGLN